MSTRKFGRRGVKAVRLPSKMAFRVARANVAGRRGTRLGALRGQVARSNARLRSRNVMTAGFLGIETKFYDTSLAATTISASATMAGAEVDPSATSMIMTPTQGDGEQSRDGKKIVVKSVIVKGSVLTGPLEGQATPPLATLVHVALVLDTQSNGAQMNSEDCFKNTGAIDTLNSIPQRNLLFSKRFRVLKTFTADLTPPFSNDAAGTSSNSGRQRNFEFVLPALDMPVNFNAGTTASIANVIDNSLHLIAYCTNPGITAQITYNARVRFVG